MDLKRHHLYEKAKEILKSRGKINYEEYSNNLEKLIEDLNIYEIELEYQNQELHNANIHINKLLEQYKELYNNTPAGYISIDFENFVVNVNQTFCSFFNIEKNDVIQKKFTQFVYPDDQDILFFYLRRVKSQNIAPDEYIKLRIYHNSIVKNVILKAKINQDNNSEILITIIDVSEQHAAQEKLKETELLWQTVFDSVAYGLCIVDRNHNLIEYNKNFADIFSIELDKPNQKFFKVFHDEDLVDTCVICNAIAKGQKATKEYHSDKTDNYYEVIVSPIENEAGFTGRSVVSVKNITQRYYYEKALKESEMRYKSIFENTHTPMLLIEPDTGMIVAANQAAVIYYGYSKELLEQMNIDQINTLSLKEIKKEMQYAVNQKKNIFQFQHRLANGEIRDVESHNGPITINGKIYLISIVIDITEKLKLEKQLIEKNKQLIEALEKAQESERLKSAFLANISHEIRTPMNGIVGFSELLTQDNVDKEKQKFYSMLIQQSADRLLATVNSLVEISKIEAGVVKLNISRFSLNEELEHLYNFHYLEAAKKNVELRYTNQNETKSIELVSDKEKIHSILNNLIKNAVKFTEKGYIEFGYKIIDDSTIELFVCDTGIGIKPERISKIFDRFSQGDLDDYYAKQGAGLGLAISKSYTEMLGGNIKVESKFGVGTKFFVTLPIEFNLIENQTMENTIDSYNLNLMRPLKVLIAEDDATSMNYLKVIIAPYTDEIFEAYTGIQAVDIVKNNPRIDLILMDMKMPEMDGYEATRKIREFNNDVIIIAQTAYGFLTDRQKALESGANEYLPKPIYRKELIQIISKFF